MTDKHKLSCSIWTQTNNSCINSEQRIEVQVAFNVQTWQTINISIIGIIYEKLDRKALSSIMMLTTYSNLNVEEEWSFDPSN